ncbi:hypothetical protein D3C86_1659280 [compost metagenome]
MQMRIVGLHFLQHVEETLARRIKTVALVAACPHLARIDGQENAIHLSAPDPELMRQGQGRMRSIEGMEVDLQRLLHGRKRHFSIHSHAPRFRNSLMTAIMGFSLKLQSSGSGRLAVPSRRG